MELMSIDDLTSATEMNKSPWYHATDECEVALEETKYNNTNTFRDIHDRKSPAMYRLVCNGELLKEDYDSPSCSSDLKKVFKVHAEISDMRPIPLSPDESLRKLRKSSYPPVNATTSMTSNQLVEARVLPLQPEVKSLTEVVMRVDSQRKKTTVITNMHNYEMTIEILNRVLKNTWLNDMVINFSMSLLQQRDTLLAGSKSLFQNTFFYSKLMTEKAENVYNYDGVKKWFKNHDVFMNVDKIFFPINCRGNCHWVLVVVFMNLKEVCYFDSLQNGCGGQPFCDNILRWLGDHAKEKEATTFDASKWRVVDYSMIMPQQKNSNDCGVFVLTVVELLSVNLPLSFTAIGKSRDQILLAIILRKFILPVGDSEQMQDRQQAVLKGGSSILLNSSAVEWLGNDNTVGLSVGASRSTRLSVNFLDDKKMQTVSGVSSSRHSSAGIRDVFDMHSPKKSSKSSVAHSPPGATGQSPQKKRGNKMHEEHQTKSAAIASIVSIAFEVELNRWLDDNVIPNGIASTATMLKLAANDLFGTERNVSTSLEDSVYKTLKLLNGDESLTQRVWDSIINVFDRRFADLGVSDVDVDIVALKSFLKKVRSANWGQSLTHEEQEMKSTEETDKTVTSSLLPLSAQSQFSGEKVEYQILIPNTECPTVCYGKCRSDLFCQYLCGMNEQKNSDAITVMGGHNWTQYDGFPKRLPLSPIVGFLSDLHVKVNSEDVCYLNMAPTTMYPIYKADGVISVSIALVKKHVLQTVIPYYQLLDDKRVTLLILSILRRISGKFEFLIASYDIAIDGHWKIQLHEEKSAVLWKLDPNCELDRNVSDELRIQCHEAFEAVYRFSDNGELGALDIANESAIASLHRRKDPPMNILRQVIDLAKVSNIDHWFPLLPNTNDMKERTADYERKGRDTLRFSGRLHFGQNVFLLGNSSGKHKKSSIVYIIISKLLIVSFLYSKRFALSDSCRCERHGWKHSSKRSML